MKKYAFLLVAMVLGLATTAGVKPGEPAETQAQAQTLIPVYAEIQYKLYGYGPEGWFRIVTPMDIGSNVTYTVTFRGHTSGDFSFSVPFSYCSDWYCFPNAAMGRAEITAVSPESDGIYDYTAAIGNEVEW